jgi:predicted metal-binding membrane protein
VQPALHAEATKPFDGRSIVVATWGISVTAWATLTVWALSSWAPLLSHGDAPGVTGALTLAAGWLLMILAMMLPLSVRLLTSVGRLVGRRADRSRLVVMAAVGVALPWLVVGQALQLGDLLLHALVDETARTSAIVLGTTFALAGALQFSDLKHRCLTRCRSPFGFVARYWHGPRPGWEALHLGAAYGWSCIGCCVGLMVVCFALGMASVVAMLAFSTLMAVERWAPAGPTIARVAGGALVAMGALVIALGLI